MEDDTLWTHFRASTLAEAEWTHVTHLRVAWMHVSRWPLDEAHLRMRVGIIRLNATHGLEETTERGYHETLTRVWLLLVGAARGDGPTSEAFLEMNPALLDRKLPLRYYSPEHLMSLAARTIFVEPDLAPLPSGA